MMCAAVAGQRGLRVLLIEHFPRLGEKIRISGGGRCNFTNLDTRPESFISANPHFARSALARYGPTEFIALVQKHRITFHEKHKGQLFCDNSSEQIIALLRAECDAGNVRWQMPCAVHAIAREGGAFTLQTVAGSVRSKRIVIATGGMSVPKIGATDYGYRVARQFGLRIVEPRPALVPLIFDASAWQPFASLAGIALKVRVCARGGSFEEDLLFTHRGLSGPAILQISSYWNPSEAIAIDLVPGVGGDGLAEQLFALKRSSGQTVGNALTNILPHRLAQEWLGLRGVDTGARIATLADLVLGDLARSLKDWQLTPSGTEGYRKAEVTRGGVATDELSQTTFEAKKVPGLHFIGEVVDVTGWLGGYNFQWAWASGHAAGIALSEDANTTTGSFLRPQ